MDLELVKLINSGISWSVVKKGHRSMRRRPRKTKASGSEVGFCSGSKTCDSVDFDYEKSGVAVLGQHFAEEVHQVPIKKRILLLQSPGQEKAIPNQNDFFGIELLAAAACYSSDYDHVESSATEEHSTPRVESYPDGIKQDISPIVSDDSSVQDNTFPVIQSLCDNRNDESDKIPVPSKVPRLHWDLNTVMDEWEEPCNIFVDHHSKKSYLEDVHSDGLQNQNRKLDVVDSFVGLTKCENVSTSTASVSETTIKVESDDKQAVSEVVQGGCLSLKCDTVDKLTSEDHLSDCCGSNVSQDKVKSGYDSPVEDGELREPATATATHTWEKEELEDLECVDYESDNMYEDNFDTIESVTNEIVNDNDHPQIIKASVSNPNNGDKEDALGSKHSQPVILVEKESSSKKLVPDRKNISCIDKPTSASCIRHSRYERDFGQEMFIRQEGSSYYDGQRVESFTRNKHGSGVYSRPKNVRSGGWSSIENNETLHYNARGSYRNESYDMHRDRSRVGLRRAPQEEYHNTDPCYSEKKGPFFASNFDRGANISRTQKQSRTRSRSGSPIAWHFQKKQNVDTKRDSETEAGLVSQPTGRMSRQFVSRSFDDRNVINGHRDKRSSPVRTFHRANQRHEPPEYLGKLKSNDRFRPRFPPSGSYSSSIHDEKYGMMNERRRFRYDNDELFKGYSRNKDSGFRYTRKGYLDSENTSEERCCRYTTNKMFNTGEGHFRKDN